MKNTFKFVVFCVLNSYINSNINAVEPNANLTVIEKKEKYVKEMGEQYKQLYSCAKKQFEQLEQIEPLTKTDEYKELKAFIINKLDSLEKLLVNLQVFHADPLCDIFSYNPLRSNDHKSFSIGMSIFDISCDNICNNSDACKLLVECNFCLSAILRTFNYLKNHNYNLDSFYKIKEYILLIKDLLTL